MHTFLNVIRAFIESSIVTYIISLYLVPIQKNRKLGTFYFWLTFALHNVFWVYSYLIESVPLKCFEYYLYYIVAWIIIDYYFEGKGFINFLRIYATAFTVKLGLFGFLYLGTGIFGQFDSAQLHKLTNEIDFVAQIYYIVSVITGFLLARLLLALCRRLKGWMAFIIVAAGGSIQMLTEAVVRAESINIVLPNIIFYFTFGLIVQRRQLSQQEKTRLHYAELEQKQKEQQEALAKLRHDLANHISIADNLEKEKQEKELLEQIDKKILTGSVIVDCLFSEKRKICEQENIILNETFIDITQSHVTNFDWISLFSNLIDNAVEACHKVEGEKRITYTMERKGDYFLFMISNSKSEKIKPLQEDFVTTKADIVHHGYGTQIIRDIANKYEGRVRYEDTSKEMKAYVILQAF